MPQETTDPASQSTLRNRSAESSKGMGTVETETTTMDTNRQSDDTGNQGGMSPSQKHSSIDFSQKASSNISWVVVKRTLHVNIFLYAFCFWIQVGVLPYLTKKLGMDMVVYGYLQTFYNFVQLVGGPFYGRFGDLYGGRAALTLAFAMAAAMYGLLGIATTGAIVFLSRVPALFLSANHGTQMVMSDLTDESQRAEALGRINLSYGLGMSIGPLVGGLVTKYYSEQHAALVSCLGSLLSVVLIQIFIPSQTKRVVPVKTQEENTNSGIFNMEKYISLVTQTPGALFFLTVTMVSALPNAILQSMFPMILMERFHLTAEYNGYMLSGMAVVGMLIQGFCMGPLTKRFSDMALLRASVVILIGSFGLLALAQDILHLMVVMLPLTIGNSVISVILSTVMTKIVTATDTGTMLGLGYAGGSLVNTFAPTIGGALLAACGFYSFGIVGVVVNCILLAILFRN
ncbi:solute carrier family 22 member 18-like [Asterias amurensis]|uniref:solute carrier family 22 member 18-like n=1 Tax=Asterias amurensis TaxID=7602 RepID=UPI003AB5F603